MDARILEKIISLRHELHQHPELSMHETATKRRLIGFLRENTELEIVDMGRWFYAVHRCGTEGARRIAFRADFDAVAVNEECVLPYASLVTGVAHKCGHDGHSAALCGLACETERRGMDKDLYFIFQHAEENGAGAQECAQIIIGEHIERIFAFHNWNGFPLGSVAIKDGTVQCASKGLTIKFTGRASHASAPESGINPAAAIAELTLYASRLSGRGQFEGMTLATVVHVSAGSPNFGIAAGEGSISLTIRAEFETDLSRLESMIRAKSAELARRDGLAVGYETCDVFPETSNDAESAAMVHRAAAELGIPAAEMHEPLRASEDFGHFLKKCPGAMFYIGDGENHAALHTPDYDFPDAILETAVELEYRIAADC